MPEESFEEQARRRVEAFGMEPAPKVWQRVEASIAPKERRRRVLLWWWLLPLCLAGGVAVWLGKHEAAKPGGVSIITDDNKKSEAGELELQAEKRKEKAENNKVLTEPGVDERNNKVDKQKRKNAKEALQRKVETGIVSGLEKKERRTAETESGFTPGRMEANLNKATPQKESDAIVKKEEAHSSGEGISLQNNAPGEDLLNQLPDLPSAATETDVTQGKEVKPGAALTTINHPLPDKAVTGKTGNKTTKNRKKSWQAGVMAETSSVSWTKSLIGNEKNISGDFYVTLPPGGLSSGNTAGTETAFHQTKNGISTGAGILVRKAVWGRIYITAQLAYHYQQYKVYHFVSIPVPQPSSAVAYSITSADYHAHFLSFGIDAGAIVWSGKRNTFSAEAGIDNGFLFTARTPKDSMLAARSGGSNNITANFYRWQPQVSVALPFSWHKAGKTSFQLAPFARLGLLTFQKNGGTYKSNHLVAAGLQGVYFFK